MKINIQRVVKCLTCAVTVFMVVLATITTPAKAVTSDVDPADYVTDITTVDGIKTVNYKFTGISPYINFWDSSATGPQQASTYQWMVGDYAEQFALTYYPLGLEAQSGWPMQSGRILTADILPGCPIDISFSIGLVFYYRQYNDAVVPNTYYPNYTAGFHTYDANGNYLDTVELTVAGDPINYDGNSGQGWTFNISGRVPLNAYAVLPWFKLDTWLGEDHQHHYMYVSLTPGDLKMSTAVDSIAEQSHQMTVIQNKMDDIISGGSAGSDLTDKTDELDKENDKLEDTMDDYHDATNNLPTTPDNFDDVVDDEALNDAIGEANKIFNWDISGLNYMFPPMTISLGLAVLFYVVFGKGD